MTDLRDMTEAELLAVPEKDLAKIAEQAKNAALLAEVMYLGGARAGGGDVHGALNLLGLELRPIGDGPVPDFEDITEERECPKCGNQQFRRTDAHGNGWYHEDQPFGFIRRCP